MLGKNLKWGYLSQILNSGINLIILPFVLFFLKPEEVGLWYNFVMLSGLVLLLDFGFSATITRNVAYAWSGSSEIKREGIASEVEDEPNLDLLSAIYKSSQRVYLVISLVSFTLLVTGGSLYLYKIAGSFKGQLISSWSVYVLAITINIAFLFWTPVLRGVGAIEYYYKSTLLSKFFQFITVVLFLYLGYGLVGVSLAYFISVILNRFLSAFYLKKYFSENGGVKLKKVEQQYAKNVFKASLPSIFKQGGLTMSNFMLDKIMLMYVSLFGGLSASASYGLTMQAFSVVTILSNVYYNTVSPKIIQNKTKGTNRVAYELLCKCLRNQIFMIFFGGVGILFLGPFFLDFIQSESKLLEVSVILIICFFLLLYNFQLVCVNYIIMDNVYPMLKGYLFSALSIPLIIYLGSFYIDIGVFEIVSAQLIVLIAYNGWKWPLLVSKSSGCGIAGFISDIFLLRK